MCACLFAQVMTERMSWGWHSLGQTSAGASLGVLLYFWSTRVPLYLAVMETLITIPLSLALLLLDPARLEWAQVCVYMYVCMFVCMYVYMYICMYLLYICYMNI